MFGIRRRLRSEWCPSCSAAPGEPCVDLIRFKLGGERRPIRFEGSWHDIAVRSEQTATVSK